MGQANCCGDRGNIFDASPDLSGNDAQDASITLHLDNEKKISENEDLRERLVEEHDRWINTLRRRNQTVFMIGAVSLLLGLAFLVLSVENVIHWTFRYVGFYLFIYSTLILLSLIRTTSNVGIRVTGVLCVLLSVVLGLVAFYRTLVYMIRKDCCEVSPCDAVKAADDFDEMCVLHGISYLWSGSCMVLMGISAFLTLPVRAVWHMLTDETSEFKITEEQQAHRFHLPNGVFPRLALHRMWTVIGIGALLT